MEGSFSESSPSGRFTSDFVSDIRTVSFNCFVIFFFFIFCFHPFLNMSSILFCRCRYVSGAHIRQSIASLQTLYTKKVGMSLTYWLKINSSAVLFSGISESSFFASHVCCPLSMGLYPALQNAVSHLLSLTGDFILRAFSPFVFRPFESYHCPRHPYKVQMYVMPIGWGFEIIFVLSLGPHRTCHFHGIRRSI